MRSLKYRSLVLILVVSFLLSVSPARAAGHGGDSVENPFATLTQHELDRVNTLDVAKCWAVVTATVATLGRGATVLRSLGSLGRAVHGADAALEHTVGGWILFARIPGLTEAGAEGLGVLIVKAAELAGFYSARTVTKDVMLKLVQIAMSAVTSCSRIIQVYYDGITKIPSVLFPRETACNGRYRSYISCQSVCGSSLSKLSQSRLYAGFVPFECERSPLRDRILEKVAEGYRSRCYQTYCSGEVSYYSDRPITRFGQCSLRLDAESRAFLDDAGELCVREREAARFLGK